MALKTKFIVLSRGRTGSTYLMGGLNSHPDIFAKKEVFHPKNPEPINGKRYNGRENSWEFVNRNLFECADVIQKVVGFKLFYFHALGSEATTAIWRHIEQDESIKLILLERENILASIISRESAKQKGAWQPNSSTYFDPVELELHLDAVEEEIDRTKRYYEWGRGFLQEERAIKTTYDELMTDAPAQFCLIARHLGVDPHLAEWPIFNQAVSSVQNTRIINISGLASRLEAQGDAWMLEPYRD